MIFLILLGAELYNAFLARTNMPQVAAQWVAGLGVSPYLVMAVIVRHLHPARLPDGQPEHDPAHGSHLLSRVMGLDFGLSPEHTAIWFGILALIVVELGLIHPPVGLNVYVIQNIAGDVSMLETFKGVVPFLIAEFFRVSLIIAFPILTLALDPLSCPLAAPSAPTR